MPYAITLSHEERRSRRALMAAAVADGKSFAAVAFEYGVTEFTVRNAAKEHNAKRMARKNVRQAIADDIAASKMTYPEIALKHGVSASTVSGIAKGSGISRRRGPRKGTRHFGSGFKVPFSAWEIVDWTKRDIELAGILGVSRERVRQVRLMLRKGKAEHHHASTTMIAVRQWIAANRSTLLGLAVCEIQQIMPYTVCATTVAKCLKSFGIEPPERPLAWSGITKENLIDYVNVTTSGCWEWRYSKDPSGYTRMGNQYGHRRSFELSNGPIPEGRMVLHKCDNPGCVNPEHLYAGTALDNARDRDERGRSGTRVLTPADIVEIRKQRMAGCTLTLLAKRFSVSVTNIHSIVRGNSWKSVPMTG